jgi:hypothetical protein
VKLARLVPLCFVLTAACGQLMGIEPAEIDASLLGGSAGTSSSGASSIPSSGSGGSSSAGTSTGGTAAHEHQQSSSGAGGEPELQTGGDSSIGGPPNPQGQMCENYCEQVTRVCKGKYEQYRTFDQCVQVCKQLPPGEDGDKDVNTVSCRMRQAELAESEPFVYCKSAGPLGEGKCGSNCVSYCSLMQAECTPASTEGNLELSFFASSQACLSACAALPAADGAAHYSTSASAEPTSFVGDTIFCRTYHLAAALEQDTPDEHCPHAMGGDPCVPQ